MLWTGISWAREKVGKASGHCSGYDPGINQGVSEVYDREIMVVVSMTSTWPEKVGTNNF